jgi:hypothetical protein
VTPGTNWFFKFFRGKVGARNLKKIDLAPVAPM